MFQAAAVLDSQAVVASEAAGTADTDASNIAQVVQRVAQQSYLGP